MIIRITLLLILLAAASFGISWMLSNNGSLIITWLGYEIRTDILTAIFCLAGLILATILITNILTRLFSFKFSSLLRIFKPSELKTLKRINQKQQDSYEIITAILLAIELNDQKQAKKLVQKLGKVIENKDLKNLLEAKMAFANQDFDISEKLYHKIEKEGIDSLIKINKFYQALKEKDEKLAIKISQEINPKKDLDFRLQQKLETIYQKNNLKDKL